MTETRRKLCIKLLYFRLFLFECKRLEQTDILTDKCHSSVSELPHLVQTLKNKCLDIFPTSDPPCPTVAMLIRNILLCVSAILYMLYTPCPAGGLKRNWRSRDHPSRYCRAAAAESDGCGWLWAPTGILSTRRGRIPWFSRSASRGTHDNRRGNTEGFSW
jgi:hypothetical protein